MCVSLQCSTQSTDLHHTHTHTHTHTHQQNILQHDQQLCSVAPESKPVASPTTDTAEDDVFDGQAVPVTEPSTDKPTDSPGVRKAPLPFKPSMIMPGLQDLSKSKVITVQLT